MNSTENIIEIEYTRTLSFKFKNFGIPFFVDVLYNKNNCLMNLGYELEHDSNDSENNDLITFTIIRNLSKSVFANKYLELNSYNSHKNINGMYYDSKNYLVKDNKNYDLNKFLDETYNMSYKNKFEQNYPYSKQPNYLLIKGYNFSNYKNKYMFLYFERTKYIKNENLIKTRTAAMEIHDSVLNMEQFFN